MARLAGVEAHLSVVAMRLQSVEATLDDIASSVTDISNDTHSAIALMTGYLGTRILALEHEVGAVRAARKQLAAREVTRR